MSRVAEDLSGQKFGRITVVGLSHVTKDYHRMYLCKCDCGTEKIMNGSSLKYGKSKSCGCLRAEQLSERRKKYNTYEERDRYIVGFIKDKEFLIDKDDYDKVKNHCWNLGRRNYVYTDIKKKKQLPHRLVMGVGAGESTIDHINGDVLDNRKSNLRKATQSQNLMNTAIRSDNKSGYKGVIWHKQGNKWSAHIAKNGKQMHLGLFENIDDAIKSRLDAEKIYHGDYARKDS